MTIYAHPEKYGLELFGEIDYAETYSFDIVAIFRRTEDGVFFWAEDSGCSCPSPFEDFTTTEDLREVTSVSDMQDILMAKAYLPEYKSTVVDLIERLHRAWSHA